MRIVWPGLYFLTNLPLVLVTWLILTGVIIGPYEGYCVDGSIVSEIGSAYGRGIRASVFICFLVVGLCAVRFLRGQSTIIYICRYVLTCVVFCVLSSVIGWFWIDSIRNAYPMGSFHEICFNDTRLASTLRSLNFMTLLFGGLTLGLLSGLLWTLPSRWIIVLWERKTTIASSGRRTAAEE